MYTVAVPIFNWFPDRTLDCEATLKQLQRVGAKRVWLCSARGIENEKRLSEELRLLKEHRIFFETHGLEVGVWISSLGHGGALMQDDPDVLERAAKYEKQVGLNGQALDDTFCPTGEAFAADYTDWIGRLAGTGIRIIMMDDDYRLCVRANGNGCCCDRHMEEFCRRVGEKVTREQLKDLIFKGESNKYRKAWLEMGNDALMSLARRLRKRVDEVDPSVRLGMCTVLSSWDVDGIDAIELAKTLAGGTKPFLRTTGAPYWCAIGFKNARPSYVTEVSRMEADWCKNSGVEIFSEGDVYPRPRYYCPASFLEVYDQALRCDGGHDGILKYVVDYTSSPRYENGYVDAAARNEPVYTWLDAHMQGGRIEGADVYCLPHRLLNADLADGYEQNYIESNFFFSAAGRMLADCSIPTAYSSESTHVVFGENGRYFPLDRLSEGMILDVTAAGYLMARGVDVGIASMSAPYTRGGTEYYPEYDEHVAVGGFSHFRDLTLKDGAQVLSTVADKPVCFRYENAQGQRFAVYAFDGWHSLNVWGVTRSYCRQKQLTALIEWAGRRKLPASCFGHPDLYMMCRRTEEGLAIGLWNMSADWIVDPVLDLDKAYAAAHTFRCEASLAGDTASLKAEIPPYGFAGIVLR